LRKEKEFTDAIVQSVPGIFYVFDEAGRFIYWNRLFEEVTGYSAEEVRTTLDGASFVPPEEREQFAARIQEVMQAGHSSLEGHVLRKDGQRVPYYFTGRRVELERGKCLVGMGIDITERRRAEDAAHRANEQLTAHAANLERLVADRTAHLEQSIASLEGVLYHVAHDLRAPLRAMHGFTSILLKEYGEHFDETGQEYARRISEAASRMDELIRDLLEYGRLCHAVMPLDKVELAAPVKRVLGALQQEINETHAEVEVHASASPVLANPMALEAIVSNLVMNSLKFVAPGATPKVQVLAEEYDGMVRLSVQDNGIGIDPKYQDKVFRVFERLHGTEGYPGTGIGLAIVQKAAQRMHAKVGVESTLGKGSTFWVELPKYA
jgi:PAS domain S-box-containing protein